MKTPVRAATLGCAAFVSNTDTVNGVAAYEILEQPAGSDGQELED
jgi:hypothetical protein